MSAEIENKDSREPFSSIWSDPMAIRGATEVGGRLKTASTMVSLTRTRKYEERVATRIAVNKRTVTYVVKSDQSTCVHFVGGTSIQVSEEFEDVMEALGR